MKNFVKFIVLVLVSVVFFTSTVFAAEGNISWKFWEKATPTITIKIKKVIKTVKVVETKFVEKMVTRVTTPTNVPTATVIPAVETKIPTVEAVQPTATATKVAEKKKGFDWGDALLGKPISEKEDRAVVFYGGVKSALRKAGEVISSAGFDSQKLYSTATSLKFDPCFGILFFDTTSLEVEYDPEEINWQIFFMGSLIGDKNYMNFPTVTIALHPLNCLKLGWDLYGGLTLNGVYANGKFSIGGTNIPVRGNAFYVGWVVGINAFLSTRWLVGLEMVDSSNLNLTWTAPEDVTKFSLRGGKEIRFKLGYSF